MFNHEGELYLVARTDPTGPFMSNYTATSELPPNQHHLYDLVAYSLRAHGTAIWRLNRETAALEWLLDLPGCGDTAFPRLVINNYLGGVKGTIFKFFYITLRFANVTFLVEEMGNMT